MNRATKLSSAITATAAGVALLAGPALAATPANGGSPWPGAQRPSIAWHRFGPWPGRAAAHAVFVQDDNPAGNTIDAYERTPAGGLQQVGSYPTGGDGGVLSGSVVDHLASEGSLSYDRATDTLLAVNAGSNTITTFRVLGDRLIRLQTTGSGGQFPVSVTTRGRVVYVLNARDGGSVSGYVQFAGRLIPVPFWHRALNLDTSTPGDSNEFTSTPGQIAFTPDGRSLLISTKNGGNSIESFGVGPFGPSRVPVTTSLPGTVPFGFAFDPAGQLALTEAGPNAVATFASHWNGTLTQLDSVATGQAATCWLVASGTNLYVSNAGSGSISHYTTTAFGTLVPAGVTATDPGTVDAAVSSDGQYLYVQTGATGAVDSYAIQADGSLAATGSVAVPNAVGAEGIVAL